MNSRWIKWILIGIALLMFTTTPLSMAQAPSAVSLYSIWIRLSLRGLNQEEIESLMSNMDPKTIVQVKNRLRNTVITNLEFKNIRQQYLTSRDSDDLNNVLTSINTEIRFAGMENDVELKLMIKDQFGIQMKRL